MNNEILIKPLPEGVEKIVVDLIRGNRTFIEYPVKFDILYEKFISRSSGYTHYNYDKKQVSSKELKRLELKNGL